MKILNIMLSRGLGGVEQAFLDYNEMLKQEKCDVVNIASSFAKIQKHINIKYSLLNLGNWDLISIHNLNLIIKKENPDVIICHGGRATRFALKARKNKNIPILGVLHSGRLKWVDQCDHIIALTKHMKEEALKSKLPKEKLSILPNCIDTSSCKIVRKEEFATPPIIGTMARFVHKKGIDTFLEALAFLKGEGIQFKAIIGGDGDEKEYYKNLSDNLGLSHYVEFIGWVSDKAEFFNEIDLFCLPSHNEPFGIILLEAMAYEKPIISTATIGPKEIIENGKDGVLIETGNNHEMGEIIASLMHNEGAARKLGKNALAKVKAKYDVKILSKNLIKILKKVGK